MKTRPERQDELLAAVAVVVGGTLGVVLGCAIWAVWRWLG